LPAKLQISGPKTTALAARGVSWPVNTARLYPGSLDPADL